MRFLLAAGADANYSSGFPLRMAANDGYVAVMTALLDAGARDFDEALFRSASGGHVPAVALLLARGADIHYMNDFSLQLAAGNGQLEMVVFLLDNGADLHARNDGALLRARMKGHTAIVALLLERARA